MTEPAQTNIDFLIGMSVFLLAVGSVFGLVPTIFEPFSVDGGSSALVADRAGAHLAEGLLGNPDDPAVLNATCTVAFFNETTADPPGCRFENNATRLETALGLGVAKHANVTIEGDGGIRTLDGTKLAAGRTPPSGSSGVVARRVVSIDGENSRLFVRVW